MHLFIDYMYVYIWAYTRECAAPKHVARERAASERLARELQLIVPTYTWYIIQYQSYCATLYSLVLELLWYII